MASSNFTAEKMLKIRIIRGTVQSATATYTTGDDCEVEEWLARRMRSQLLALIHGEDEIQGALADPTVIVRAMLGESETRDVAVGAR